MARIEHSDIITTPEAKGRRSHPAAAGTPVQAKDFMARPVPVTGMRREVPLGRFESTEDYARLKLEALTSAEATRAPELLQADVQSTKSAAIFATPKLPADFAGLGDTGWAPPDCSLAAGPSHLVAATNSAWAALDKAGNPLLRATFSDWFSGVVADAVIHTPKVMYDQYSGRWVIAACGRSAAGDKSWFLISASQTRNPLGAWWIWALDAALDGTLSTRLTADGLGLGVDQAALYLTANMFAGQGEFQYAKLRILNKSELYTGGVIQWWDFWELRNPNGSLAFGVQPAHTFGAPGTQYLVNATNDGLSLTQWNLTQSLGPVPHLSRRAITTAAYHLAPNARQPKTAREVETGDTRFVNAVFRNGVLWTAHTVAVNWEEETNVSAIQWFQINPGAGVITQQHLYGAPGYFYFCPTMMVDGQSNLIMVFNRAGQSELPAVRFTGRVSTDLPGTLHASALLKESGAAAIHTWGSYNGAAVDPNDTKVWIIGQYVTAESEWATWIGETSYIASSAEGNGNRAKKPVYA